MKRKNLFINQVIDSIKNFDSYKEISECKVLNSFIYFLLLILIYAIISTIGITYKTNAKIKNAQNFIRDEISSISYNDGILSVNGDEYSSYYGNYLIIDTSENANIEDYNASMIFGKRNFYIKVEQNMMKFSYSNFFNQNVDKDTIVEALNSDNYTALIIIVSLVGAFIVLSISTLLDILVIAVIGFIISEIIGNNKIKFKNAFNIAVHAVTLSVILGMVYFLVNTFTGFYVKYFSTMYTLLATIYMVTAVILINAEDNSNNS
ncbi:MAG: DUF1189 domain-containing protein [Clostridia bacterium]|nr:DUF1189 domain-containing protein [Clostridia bacterium]